MLFKNPVPSIVTPSFPPLRRRGGVCKHDLIILVEYGMLVNRSYVVVRDLDNHLETNMILRLQYHWTKITTHVIVHCASLDVVRPQAMASTFEYFCCRCCCCYLCNQEELRRDTTAKTQTPTQKDQGSTLLCPSRLTSDGTGLPLLSAGLFVRIDPRRSRQGGVFLGKSIPVARGCRPPICGLDCRRQETFSHRDRLHR